MPGREVRQTRNFFCELIVRLCKRIESNMSKYIYYFSLIFFLKFFSVAFLYNSIRIVVFDSLSYGKVLISSI